MNHSDSRVPQLHFTVCRRDRDTERPLADWMRRKQSFSASLFSLSLASPFFYFVPPPAHPSSIATHHPFVSPCLFQPRPYSLAPSLCAVMKISQAATHNGVPTSGVQTPQILPQAANPGGKPGSTHHPRARPACALHCHMLRESG